MGRKSRTCYLCGEAYKYCPTCSSDRVKPAWMSEFHTENCKDIFDICTRFNMQMLDKQEAVKALEKCDLTNKEKFRPSVQNTLANLFKVEEESKKRGKRVEAPICDIKSHEVVKQENE